MPKHIKKLSSEDELESFSKFVSSGTQKLLRGYAKSHNFEINDLLLKYIKELVKSALIDVVMKYENENVIRTQQEIYELTYSDYQTFKFKLTSEIADAFGKVMSSFGNSPIDFYCEIAPMPDPINKEPV